MKKIRDVYMTFCLKRYPTKTLEDFEQDVLCLEGLFDGMQSHTPDIQVEDSPGDKPENLPVLDFEPQADNKIQKGWDNHNFVGVPKKKKPAEQ